MMPLEPACLYPQNDSPESRFPHAYSLPIALNRFSCYLIELVAASGLKPFLHHCFQRSYSAMTGQDVRIILRRPQVCTTNLSDGRLSVYHSNATKQKGYTEPADETVDSFRAYPASTIIASPVKDCLDEISYEKMLCKTPDASCVGSSLEWSRCFFAASFQNFNIDSASRKQCEFEQVNLLKNHPLLYQDKINEMMTLLYKYVKKDLPDNIVVSLDHRQYRYPALLIDQYSRLSTNSNKATALITLCGISEVGECDAHTFALSWSVSDDIEMVVIFDPGASIQIWSQNYRGQKKGNPILQKALPCLIDIFSSMKSSCGFIDQEYRVIFLESK